MTRDGHTITCGRPGVAAAAAAAEHEWAEYTYTEVMVSGVKLIYQVNKPTLESIRPWTCLALFGRINIEQASLFISTLKGSF